MSYITLNNITNPLQKNVAVICHNKKKVTAKIRRVKIFFSFRKPTFIFL